MLVTSEFGTQLLKQLHEISLVSTYKTKLVLLCLFLKYLLEENMALPVRAKPKSTGETCSSF
jgi:hypothetical protein